MSIDQDTRLAASRMFSLLECSSVRLYESRFTGSVLIGTPLDGSLDLDHLEAWLACCQYCTLRKVLGGLKALRWFKNKGKHAPLVHGGKSD